MAYKRLLRVLVGSGIAAALVVTAAGCGQPPLPDLSGMSAAQAAQALEAAEFSGRFDWEESAETPGEVLSQDPAPGDPEPEPRVVDVTVSGGTPFSADDAIGTDWEDNFPGGGPGLGSDEEDAVTARCSALGGPGARPVAEGEVMVDPYVSPSGIGGGTLLVTVRLIRASSAGAAESLLQEERDAQAACAASRDGSNYSVLPDAGAVSNSTEYSSATVNGYPALRTDSLVVAASPVIGGGVASSFTLDVTWRQGRNLIEVSRTEVFGQTLPPRQSGVPSDLEATVRDVKSAVAAEIARSQSAASALRRAKQALEDAQTGTPSASNDLGAPAATTTSSRGPATDCSSPTQTSLTDLRVSGVTCAEAQELARQSWFREVPRGYSCSTITESRVSRTSCTGPSASFTYVGDPPAR